MIFPYETFSCFNRINGRLHRRSFLLILFLSAATYGTDPVRFSLGVSGPGTISAWSETYTLSSSEKKELFVIGSEGYFTNWTVLRKGGSSEVFLMDNLTLIPEDGMYVTACFSNSPPLNFLKPVRSRISMDNGTAEINLALKMTPYSAQSTDFNVSDALLYVDRVVVSLSRSGSGKGHIFTGESAIVRINPDSGSIHISLQIPDFRSSRFYRPFIGVHLSLGTDVLRAEIPYSAPTEKEPYHPNLGPKKRTAVLTFDDDFVEQWYALKDFFKKNHVMAVFYVSKIDRLNDRQITMLSELQKDGHEIAAHSLRHENVFDYGDSPEKIEEYIRNEIIPCIEAMEARGFEPVSFAYPYGNHYASYDSALYSYFASVRGVVPGLPADPWYLYSLSSGNRTVYGISVDNLSKIPLTAFGRTFDKAVDEGKTVILYGHKPVETPDADGNVDTTRLSEIISLAHQKGFRFVTMRELFLGP